MVRRLVLVLILGLLPLGTARAVLEIQITQGVSTAVPVAVVPFAWQVQGPPPATPTRIARCAKRTHWG